MPEKDYLVIARQQLADEAAQRAQTEIEQRATQLRLADEREQQLADLRTLHGLHPAAGLREISDAQIEHGHKWRDFVLSRYAGGRGTEVLSPETVTDPVRRAEIEKVQSMMRAQFDKEYAAEAARRRQPSGDVTDSAMQARAHNTGVAA